MDCAPVIVTVYHRYEMFKRCIEALQRCLLASESELYVVSDAAFKTEHIAAIDRVRNYAKTITGFKVVHLLFREQNLGSYRSGNEAIDEVLKTHDRFIFLEDDIVVAPGFLQYLNDGLSFYKDDRHVFAICAYKPILRIPRGYHADVFAVTNFSPWGFGMWRDRRLSINLKVYDRFSELRSADPSLYEFLQRTDPGFMGLLKSDSEGKLKATDVRVEYHIYRHNLVSIFPCVSFSANRGCCEGGEHCGGINGITDVDMSVSLQHLDFPVSIKALPLIHQRYLASKQPGRLLRWTMEIRRNGFWVWARYYCPYYSKRLIARIQGHA